MVWSIRWSRALWSVLKKKKFLKKSQYNTDKPGQNTTMSVHVRQVRYENRSTRSITIQRARNGDWTDTALAATADGQRSGRRKVKLHSGGCRRHASSSESDSRVLYTSNIKLAIIYYVFKIYANTKRYVGMLLLTIKKK